MPHDRDEVYIVVSGTGWFARGDERVAFRPGDALFVPAQDVHRFANFSPDFATWVMFYGPVGGENPDRPAGGQSRRRSKSLIKQAEPKQEFARRRYQLVSRLCHECRHISLWNDPWRPIAPIAAAAMRRMDSVIC